MPDLAAFRSRYGDGPRVAGEYDLNISNAGEHVTLTFGPDNTIQEFTFDDLWHPTTDGAGFSLVVMNAGDPNLDHWSEPTGWRPSFESGGSPGQADVLSGDYNSDNRVGLIDLAILQGSFGGSATRADVARFSQNLGRFYIPSSPSPAAAGAIATSESVRVAIDRRTRLSTRRGPARLPMSQNDAMAPSTVAESVESTKTALRARRRVAPADFDSIDRAFNELSR